MKTFYDVRNLPGLKKKPSHHANCSTGSSCWWPKTFPLEALQSKDDKVAVPPLVGALLKNEQDVTLFEKLVFMQPAQPLKHSAGEIGLVDMKNHAMSFVEPVTLSERGVTLEPLALAHEAGLRAAAADGELWNLRVTSVPEPEQTRQYIEDALAMREAGNRFAFAVLDAATGRVLGSSSYHDILPAVKRVEIGYTWYAQERAAHPCQHHLQAAADDACLRDAGLPRGGLAHRQLQLRLASAPSSAWARRKMA